MASLRGFFKENAFLKISKIASGIYKNVIKNQKKYFSICFDNVAAVFVITMGHRTFTFMTKFLEDFLSV